MLFDLTKTDMEQRSPCRTTEKSEEKRFRRPRLSSSSDAHHQGDATVSGSNRNKLIDCLIFSFVVLVRTGHNGRRHALGKLRSRGPNRARDHPISTPCGLVKHLRAKKHSGTAGKIIGGRSNKTPQSGPMKW